MDDEPQESVEPLTSREMEILQLIADGLTNQQIANRLFLTLDTVKWYNQQSFQKLGVHSRTQALARVRELELIGIASPTSTLNLPAQSTAFVGRKAELAAIRSRLDDPTCRLLTLVGPGGIGKTRLAIESAQQMCQAFPDGIYFVPLATIESPAFILQALAAALKLAQMGDGNLIRQISTYLREKQVLLVIDNFEHLLDGASLLAELLDKSVQVKLLVTSRERLHLKGEWVFDVPGLHHATVDLLTQSIDLLHYEAIQLFMQTAQRVRPDFSAETEDMAQVAYICQLVGGMPLGIELSASWRRALSCGQISREIEHGLDILETSWRDVTERHRSIRAVLDHSWKMLTDTEQQVFARLTIFSGSFQHAAAVAVTGTALATMLSLVDKSCLQRVGSERFAVHELLRQYGYDKLCQNEDHWTETRQCHCRYYTSFLSERMAATDLVMHLGAIELEFDNIRAAWRYAVGQQQRNEIRALVIGLFEYYSRQSWYRAGPDAIELYQQALGIFASDTSDSDQSTTIICLYESLGHLYELSGDGNQALNCYQQALLSTETAKALRRGRIQCEIAQAYVLLNNHEEADRTYTQAEAILEQVEQRDLAWWQEWARVQIERMELYYWLNRLEAMIDLNGRIGALVTQHAMSNLRIRYLNTVALMVYRRDRYFRSDDAITASGQALALSLETGNLGDIAWSSFLHGFGHLWSDKLDDAEKHLNTTRRMTEQNGDLTLLARALTYLTVVYRKRGDTVRTQAAANDSLTIAAEVHMLQYTGTAHAAYAWLAWRESDLAGTVRQAQAAIDDWAGIAETIMPFRWLALFPLLGVALQQAEITKAIPWIQDMLRPSQPRLPDDLTQLLGRAIAAWEQDLPAVARDWLQQAFQCAQTLGYV